MKIIKPTDAITVAHPVVLLYSEPGYGKSTLGYMTRRPIVVDYDRGAHRAQNRQDTVQPETWAEVEELLASDMSRWDTFVVDTVGRCLDMLALQIIADEPKRGYQGALDQKGWGILKGRFQALLARLRGLGKDVVLLAHLREDKDGDERRMVPDIQGGSYGEVLKSADLVGLLTIQAKKRYLEFSPSSRSVGKNPAGWKLTEVPNYADKPAFLSGLLDDARKKLGAMSEESAKAAAMIADWSATIEDLDRDGVLVTVPTVRAIKEPLIQAQVKAMLWKKAKALGLTAEELKAAPSGKKSKPAAEEDEAEVLV